MTVSPALFLRHVIRTVLSVRPCVFLSLALMCSIVSKWPWVIFNWFQLVLQRNFVFATDTHVLSAIVYYRAMLRRARYCYGKSYVCLFVCPIVTDVGVSWSHRLEIFKTNFTLGLHSLECSLFADPDIVVLIEREHPEILAGIGEGYRKSGFRRTIALISLKRGKIRPILLFRTNRKSLTRFRLVPKNQRPWMTLKVIILSLMWAHTARCYAERGIATASCLSVCLSVYPFVRPWRWGIVVTLDGITPLELHLTTSELWFGQEQEGILP